MVFVVAAAFTVIILQISTSSNELSLNLQASQPEINFQIRPSGIVAILAVLRLHWTGRSGTSMDQKDLNKPLCVLLCIHFLRYPVVRGFMFCWYRRTSNLTYQVFWSVNVIFCVA